MGSVRNWIRGLGENVHSAMHQLGHRLRATGGTAGQELANALESDVRHALSAPATHLALEDALQTAVDALASGVPGGPPVVHILEHVAVGLGETAARALCARIQCRLAGLDPDKAEPADTQATTAARPSEPGSAAVVSAPQRVDAGPKTL